VRQARFCRPRDALTVVPRYGFSSPEDYYACTSVAFDLHRLRLPALLVASRGDPIIPPHTLVPVLRSASRALSVRWGDGGHVFFPRSLHLGEPAPAGLESQVIHWLASREGGEDVSARRGS
jgi:predicted alpha/beta-fold hydrolase